MLSIGLDIGTTGLCAVLVDTKKNEVLKTVNAENSFFIPTEHEYERIQDAQKLYEEAKGLVDALFCPDVKSIGVTGQMHGIVYLDGEGRLLSPLYTWQDGRGNLCYDGDVTYATRFSAPTGYGLTTDFYNEINGLVPKDAKKLCTIHDYTAMSLAGLKSPVMHSSDAASLGKYDCESGSFTLQNPRLPEVTKKIREIGKYRGASVFTAIGDNQASFLGSVSGNMPLINVGTGSQVSIPVDSYQRCEGLETRPLDGDRYILVGSSLCGGRAFALLERFFSSVVEMAGGSDEKLYKKIDEMLENYESTDLLFDTRFCGTREQPELKAAVTNLGTDNFTAADFALSVLNGIADELYGFYEKSGAVFSSIAGSGNGIRKNPALKRVLEKRFNCRLVIPDRLEEAAYGAAISVNL